MHPSMGEFVPDVRPEEIELTTPDGELVRLSEYRADPLIVVLVRYFGCLPCQHFLQRLDARLDQLPDGAGVVAIGGSAEYQARWLRDRTSVSVPLLLDPEQRVRRLAEIGRLTPRQLGSLEGWKSYGRALLAGFLPQLPTFDANKAPGIVVFNRDLDVEWLHKGNRMGDYPSVEELVARVSSRT